MVGVESTEDRSRVKMVGVESTDDRRRENR